MKHGVGKTFPAGEVLCPGQYVKYSREQLVNTMALLVPNENKEQLVEKF